MPRFQTRVRQVEALQLGAELAEKLHVASGDFLILHDDGRHEILGAEAFDQVYERVSENGHSPPRQAGRQAGRQAPLGSPRSRAHQRGATGRANERRPAIRGCRPGHGASSVGAR